MGLSSDLLLSCDSKLDHTIDTSHSYRHIPSSPSLQFLLFTRVCYITRQATIDQSRTNVQLEHFFLASSMFLSVCLNHASICLGEV